ncbi:16S rRNA (guanine(966)-N(2))-methyltransferase RsmD [Kocuria sp. HSID16901]|uniref:16S rRNA (guanine(966)-N(2))-methyltransferase RsmD n=1 Tax=Kocuria sp. HSID16901 TaxID=2419505 RepID=UPI000660A9F7|nr:16S rRNA (guanine(966)-N(2))-methyltransferase RsmD [Kocuria sp. HSID16901]RUQ22449.1 16S rRNA (guanine(966)-N(2))-methyltransferase RsmD [Kocuria sp. HSID16901]
MGRIIAGAAGGARLASVRGDKTRPTTDRVKEALFSRLDTYDVLTDSHVLDLFAGSGALGLEAASRGASHVTLVDRDRAALEACRANRDVVAKTGLFAEISVVNAQAGTFLGHGDNRWDVVFVDPPYAMTDAELTEILASLSGRLTEGAVVVVERSTRSPEPAWGDGLSRFGHKAYGETTLWFAEPELGSADGED